MYRWVKETSDLVTIDHQLPVRSKLDHMEQTKTLGRICFMKVLFIHGFTTPKTNMTMENPPWMKMYFILKMGIFPMSW